jgi:short-subunit dehydrogenase
MSRPETKTQKPKYQVTHARNLLFWRKNIVWKPNSIIVITGAGSGIGKNVSLLYSRRRCRMVLGSIDSKELNAVADQCQRNGSEVLAVPTDVTVPEQCKRLMDAAVSKFGGIDILVLCAGIGAHHTFGKTKDLNVYKKLVEVNYYGYLHCIHYAYPYLQTSIPRGLVVAITSFSGEVGLPYRTGYCASKFAVTGFLEALRAEMHELSQKEDGSYEEGFDICIVCPPTVSTSFRKNSIVSDDDDPMETVAPKHAMTVEECASAIIDAADRRLRKAFFSMEILCRILSSSFST